MRQTRCALALSLCLLLAACGGGEADGGEPSLLETAANLDGESVLLTVDGREVPAWRYLYWLAYTCGQIAQRYGATTADGDLTAAMEQLNTGRADGHVNNVAAVEEYMESRPEVNVKIAAIYEPAEENRYEIESSVMCRKEDQSLCDGISEVLQEMIDDGFLYDLTVEYFGQSVADSTSIYQ